MVEGRLVRVGLEWGAVLLEHSHIHCSCIVFGFIYATTAELSSWDRECMACKTQNIYYVALHRKSLLASALEGKCRKVEAENNHYGTRQVGSCVGPSVLLDWGQELHFIPYAGLDMRKLRLTDGWGPRGLYGRKAWNPSPGDLIAQAFLSPPAAFVQKIMWNACVHSTWE